LIPAISPSDFPNYVLAVVAVVSPLVSVAIVFGRRSGDVSSITKRLDKLDGGTDEEIRERATQAEKIKNLETVSSKVDKLREEFVEFRTAIKTDHTNLSDQLKGVIKQLEGLQRSVGRLAAGEDRVTVTRIGREDHD
jgi:hypothetical protein